MAAKLKLTWDKKSKRWKKVYRGKQYYFPYGTSKTDRIGYQRALEEWNKLKTELDANADKTKPHRFAYETAIHFRQKMVDWCSLQRNWIEATEGGDSYVKQFARFWGDYASKVDVRSIDENTVDPEQLERNVRELCAELGFPIDLPQGRVVATDDEQLEAEHQEQLDFLRQTQARLNREIKQLRHLFSRVSPPKLDAPDTLPIHPLEGEDYARFHQWTKQLEQLNRFEQLNGAVDYPDTIAGNIESFLDHKRRELEAGQIKPSWYQTLPHRLKHFSAFAGSRPVQELNERLLTAFHNELRRRIADGECKQNSARNVITTTKSFVTWLWEEGIIESLPRNLKRLTITVDSGKIDTFSADELNAVLGGAVDRTKLYILLMLNCGYYQNDIANLLQSEIDWKTGRVVRKRSKTAKRDNVPVVNYPLWDETFRLLTEHRAEDSKHALVNANGEKLVREGRNDNIKSAYSRVCRKLKIDTKPLMLLRKTAATKLEEHDTFGRFTQYFLGQAPQSLAERRYAKPSGEQFDRAVIWLGKQFGLKTNRKRLIE